MSRSPFEDESRRRAYWKAFDRKRAAHYGRARNSAQDYLDERTELAQEAVLASYSPADAIRRAVQAVGSEKAVRATLVKIWEPVVMDFARDAWEGLTADKAAKAGEEPVTQWQQFVNSFLAEAAGEKISGINATTRQAVRQVLSELQSEGKGIDEMARALDDATGLGRNRATLIARTEVIGTSNAGSWIGAKSTGLKLDKEWIATPDGRTRATHRSADGQIVAHPKPFTVGGAKLMWPGDGSLGAPIDEIAQCRCTIAHIPVR